MKSKLVSKVISNKILHWIESIKDENVKKLCQENTIVTGGSITSLLLNEKVNDYDIYFRNKETVKAVTNYYINEFKEMKPDIFKNNKLGLYMREENDRIKVICTSVGVVSEKSDQSEYHYFEYREELDEAEDNYIDVITDLSKIIKKSNKEKTKEKTKYYPKFFTSNAITLSDGVQLIIRFYGNPAEIHKNYDFIHCTNYWDIKDKHLELSAKALDSILTKTLYYVGSLYPVSSVIRTRKFIKRGWHISGGEFLKMCFQISNLDLTNISVLEDQLVGVDYVYFREIIDVIKGEVLKNKDFKIDNTYLFKLIDRIF